MSTKNSRNSYLVSIYGDNVIENTKGYVIAVMKRLNEPATIETINRSFFSTYGDRITKGRDVSSQIIDLWRQGYIDRDENGPKNGERAASLYFIPNQPNKPSVGLLRQLSLASEAFENSKRNIERLKVELEHQLLSEKAGNC